MASESKASKPESREPLDWRPKASLGVFLRDVAIAAVILGLGLWLYHSREMTRREVRALGKEAKDFLVKDTPKGYVEAEKRLAQMIELDDEYPFAVGSLGELYATRWLDLGIEGDADKAREWTKKAGKLEANINERFGAVLLGMLGEKDFAGAEKYATEITKVAASSHVVNGLGRAFRGQGKLDEARIALKKSADTEWRNPRFACDIADLYFEDGDYVNAFAFYGKGLEANSEHARSMIGRARSLIARGQRIPDAAQLLSDVLERPEDQMAPMLKSQVLTAKAELALFSKQFDQAIKAADEAIAAYAKYPWAHYAKARALAAQQSIAAADALNKALELDRFVPEYYYGGATLLLEAGDAVKATALLDSYTKSLKEDDRFHLNYGNLLAKLGKADEALVHFDKAIDQNNFNAQAHYSKGALLAEAKKDYENGKKELELALEVQEYYPDVYAKLGDIHFDKKEYADGCQQYAQALIQMKQLQAPMERMTGLRDRINERLIKEARQRDMAKAWMDETGALIR